MEEEEHCMIAISGSAEPAELAHGEGAWTDNMAACGDLLSADQTLMQKAAAAGERGSDCSQQKST